MNKPLDTGQGRYDCTLCGKSYARSDVLSRHMVRHHGTSPPVMGRPRKMPCQNCRIERVVCSGIAPDPCSRCQASGSTCKYLPQPRPSASPDHRNRSSGSARKLSSVVDPTDRQPQLMMESPETAMASYRPPATPQASDIGIHNPASSADLFLLAAATTTTTTDNSEWFTMLGLDPPVLQYADWSLPETEPDGNVFEVLNTHAPNTPTWDFLDSLIPPTQDPSSQGLDRSPEERLHGTPSEILDGQPYDSPWPHIDKPRSSDVDVSLPHSYVHSIHSSSSLAPVDSLQELPRQTMITTVSRSHQPIWPTIDTTNFPSTQTLTVCINLYQRHFHDWLPIIERASFKMGEAAPLILMSMSAIGAMYSQDGLQRLGVALSELVRRAVLFIRESDRRFMFETNIIQAFLLQTYFGFFCGSHKSFQQAEWSRGALVIACKRMHLLRPGMSATQTLYLKNADPSREDIAKAEKEDRRRARLGWGIYLLECQLACLVNLPAQLSIAEVITPFPTLASLQSNRNEGERPTFAEVLDGFLTNGIAPVPLDDLGYSIISYTLYRLCMDASALQSIQRHQPGVRRFKLSFPTDIKHHPQILLGRIASHTLNLAVSPTPLLMSCSALAHHSHLQFTHPGFIELVKAAAGKSGTMESRIGARQTLEQWINQDRYSARVVFAHAAMLACLLKRYTFDTPTEVIWTFDSALCLWAIIRFSFEPIAVGSPMTTIAWSETPQIENWILNGGGAIVQGLGDVSLLPPASILQHFAKQLETLSWGLAEQYRQIIITLIQEQQG
ncbi:hypothetical protein BCR39DRAFT_542336 [Naematelia encephala]|uniref:Fungal-specific transcription factor domain-domain-containing protein n=1 Tax=Naematelia encephala TaxID=71784 RepID=A0A1Y2AU13_9TREE|nr:hypothetical protein BCR39DRAFT_542336 [Naematelia encephala]